MAPPVAIILAGGANRRFWPLEQKSLLRFGDSTLLDRRIGELAAAGIEDVVLVANPANEQRMRQVAADTPPTRVHIVVQPTPAGMGDAVLQCAPLFDRELGGRPVLVNQVHDLVDPSLFGRIVARADDRAADAFIVGVRLTSYFPGGYLVLKDGRAVDVIEKPPPGTEPSDLMKIVVDLVRDSSALFDALRAVESNPTDQYERAFGRLMARGTVQVLDYDGAWLPIKYPWDVLRASEFILGQMSDEIAQRAHPIEADGTVRGPDVMVHPGAITSGTIVFGEGARVDAGATIVGPTVIGAGTRIGTGAVVRESMLGDGCIVNPGAVIQRSLLGRQVIAGNGALVRNSVVGATSVVGFASELARSYVGENCWFHTNYVGDSVLGDDVSFGSGTTTANLRLDEANIRVSVDGGRVDTGMNKIGALIGSHVRAGINASLMPGVRLGSNSAIGPGVILSRDLEDGKFLTVRQEHDVRDNPYHIDGSSRASFLGALRPGPSSAH